MVDIPTSRVVARAQPNSSRPRSQGPQPMQGRALAGFSQNLGAVANNMDAVADNLDRAVERSRIETEEASKFETERRFLEFAASEQDRMTQERESVQPGAFGYSEQARASYMENAKKFKKTVPEQFRDQYDNKLFGVEDRLISNATEFERTARRQHYGNAVDDGLATVEANLFSNPDKYDENLAAGYDLINSIPDSGFSQIEKEELRRTWERKAKLSVLNGVTPEERIRLLGGIGTPEAFNPSQGLNTGITKGINGTVRSVITGAAQRHGVDPQAMLVIAWLESKGDPSARNDNSSAGGLFQQIDGNAAAYGVQDRFDASQSADGAARFMVDNRAELRRVLGREPTIGELYLAHQQGAGGATKLLSNPNARAVDLVGVDEVEKNGGHANMTAGEFAQLWLRKAGDTHIPDGGLMGAAFNPENADPRFVDFDYMDATKAIQSAQKSIIDMQTAQNAGDQRLVSDWIAWSESGQEGQEPPLPVNPSASLTVEQQERFVQAAQVGGAVSAVNATPLAVMDQRLEQLKPSGSNFEVEQAAYDAALGAAVVRAEDEAKNYSLLERADLINQTQTPEIRSALVAQQKSYMSSLAKDQVGLLRQNGVDVPDIDPTDITGSLSARLDLVKGLARQNGVRPVILTPAETVSITSQFENMNLVEKMTFVQEFSQDPEIAEAFFSEISDAAPFLSHAGGVLNNGGDSGAVMVAMKGYQASLDKFPFDDLSQTDKSLQFGNDMTEALRGIPDAIGAIDSFASNYARGKATQNAGLVSQDDYAKGLKKAIGETYRYNRPGITSGSAKAMILPPETSSQQMTEFLNGMTDDFLTELNGGEPVVDAHGVEVGAEYIRNNADYMTIGPGAYVVEVDGEPFLSSNGVPFILRYRQ